MNEIATPTPYPVHLMHNAQALFLCDKCFLAYRFQCFHTQQCMQSAIIWNRTMAKDYKIHSPLSPLAYTTHELISYEMFAWFWLFFSLFFYLLNFSLGTWHISIGRFFSSFECNADGAHIMPGRVQFTAHAHKSYHNRLVIVVVFFFFKSFNFNLVSVSGSRRGFFFFFVHSLSFCVSHSIGVWLHIDMVC